MAFLLLEELSTGSPIIYPPFNNVGSISHVQFELDKCSATLIMLVRDMIIITIMEKIRSAIPRGNVCTPQQIIQTKLTLTATLLFLFLIYGLNIRLVA